MTKKVIVNVKAVKYEDIGRIVISDNMEQFIDEYRDEYRLVVISGKFAIFKEKDESCLLVVWPDDKNKYKYYLPIHEWVVERIKEHCSAVFLGAGFIRWNFNEVYNKSNYQMKISKNFQRYIRKSAVPLVEFNSVSCRKSFGYDRPESIVEQNEILSIIREKVLEIRDRDKE